MKNQSLGLLRPLHESPILSTRRLITKIFDLIEKHEIRDAIKASYGCSVGHIGYFNSRFLESLRWSRIAFVAMGFIVHIEWDHGCMAGVPLDYLPSLPEAAWRLLAALEKMGVFTRSSERNLLDQYHVPLEQFGSFLVAFEKKFGKNFATNYSDGLRLVGSTWIRTRWAGGKRKVGKPRSDPLCEPSHPFRSAGRQYSATRLSANAKIPNLL